MLLKMPHGCGTVHAAYLFTLRQASRRSWRIGQKEDCRVVYLYYEGTMQDRAIALMGKKLTAAQALEGKFSSEGLVAMAGEDANMELALARSLVNRMDEGDARRLWGRTTHSDGPSQLVTISPDHLPVVAERPIVRAMSLFDLIEEASDPCLVE
ncbi:MAG TPA: hypothetical protein VFE62_28045 [Gemmataceae bacterium]|nr:hypothetical protein [Gemmataceae bacterium]